MQEGGKTINLTNEQFAKFQEIARAWELGDWKHIAHIEADFFINSDVYGEILAYQASACYQLGDIEKGAAQAKKAYKQSGNLQRVFSIIFSGVHNSFGRANLLLNHQYRAREQFSLALAFSASDYRHPIAVDNRINTQQVALEACSGRAMIEGAEPSLSKKSVIELGDGWAGNTINTVIFRHHGIMSVGDLQFTAFYQDHHTIVFIKRNLKTDEIERFALTGEYNLNDAHNSISLGVDRSGYIHVSYDHHGTKLKYRRSEHPLSINGWSDELPMTGVNEQKVTYPTFIIPKNDSPLLMLYRDGNWKKGSAYLKRYEESTLSWEDYPLPILSGAENKPWTSNAYWNNPVIDNHGCLHLSYVWRTDYFSDQQLVNNINIGYAKSYDFGKSWVTIKNQPYKLPITQVNSDVVWPITPGSNLINQCSMAIDSLGFPHIAFYANDANEIPQYQYVWNDGKHWHHRYISKRVSAFNLTGGGTLKIPISRPEVLVDKDDNVYVITRSDVCQQKLTLLALKSKNRPEDEAFELWEEALGQSEPIVDRCYWDATNIITVLVQKNLQPDGDREIRHKSEKTYLVDFG